MRKLIGLLIIIMAFVFGPVVYGAHRIVFIKLSPELSKTWELESPIVTAAKGDGVDIKSSNKHTKKVNKSTVRFMAVASPEGMPGERKPFLAKLNVFITSSDGKSKYKFAVHVKCTRYIYSSYNSFKSSPVTLTSCTCYQATECENFKVVQYENRPKKHEFTYIISAKKSGVAKHVVAKKG